MVRATDTIRSEEAGAEARFSGWMLALSLDCEDLTAAPLRLPLQRLSEVEIGRGERRAVDRAGRRLRIDLPDRWTSQIHARLARAGDDWELEDAGSKNGTRLNGRLIDRAPLGDGDVIECGGTFLVMRRAEGSVGETRSPASTEEALQTVSPVVERELSRLPKIARSRLPVLVLGASGSGKEVVAHAIHALSGRRGPLVTMNCGAVPATLVENELFGSQRGAFSGAENRPGLVRSAEHGTLFLDEVAELPATAQAALLRVLQDGEMAPLGADKRIIVDVRIIAATNRPVEELVADGRFREDLLARLRGYEIRLPKLRDRIEDLGFLVPRLLRRIEPDGPPRTLSRRAARALFLHAWPLQIRELQHALHAAVTVATGTEIRFGDLPLAEATPAPPDEDAELKERMIALLRKHEGNVTAIARKLNTSRSQVLRLVARYGLAAAEYRRR